MTNGITTAAPVVQTTTKLAFAGPTTTTSLEIEAARRSLEQIFQNGSASGLGAGTSSAGSRALGVLVKGLGLTVSTFSIWNAMAQPAGIPALQEALMVNGPDGFFDRLAQQTQAEGGSMEAVNALRDTVTGFLEQGRIHSAGVVLGETLTLLQDGGLISRSVNAGDLGMSAALQYAQANPSVLQNNLLPTAAPVNRPDTTVAAPQVTSSQAPLLTTELQAFRNDVKNGLYANSAEAYQAGRNHLDRLINQGNQLIEQGQNVIDNRAVGVAATELNFRRLDSVMAQFERNAIFGGPLPTAAGYTSLVKDVRALDSHIESTYGVEGWSDASLEVMDQRISSAIDLRGRFDQFSHQVGAGMYANSAADFASGTARLEAFRLESNQLGSTLGIAGISQEGYDANVLQLEGRRQNSVIAQGMRDIAAGEPVDLDSLGNNIQRLEDINARNTELFGQPVISGVAAYRDVWQNALKMRHDAAVADQVELEPLESPITLPGGNDIQRVAEEYGVAQGDIARVMEQNPGMSPEQAAQYLKGALLVGPTGLNMAQLPPAPPNDGGASTVTGAGDAEPPGEPVQLNASDLGFRVKIDTTTDTSVVFVEFLGQGADVQRQLYENGPYELTDSYNMQTGQHSVQVRSRETGEVLGTVDNARLAKAADRFAEVVEFNADKLFSSDPVVRNKYLLAWRSAIKVVLNPNSADRAQGKPPGNPVQDSVTRLYEALQGERIQIDRQGNGVEIILPEGSLPEARDIPGIRFEPPGQAPDIP